MGLGHSGTTGSSSQPENHVDIVDNFRSVHREEPDQVSFVGVQLVRRSVLKIFPYKIS